MDSAPLAFNPIWIVLAVVGFLVSFITPWLFVWRYRARRRNLLTNGRPAQAKILEIQNSGTTFGTSSNNDNIRGVIFLLEVYPDGGPPYQVKTRDQLHLLDLTRIAPGMLVTVKVDPNNSQRVAVDFGGNNG